MADLEYQNKDLDFFILCIYVYVCVCISILSVVGSIDVKRSICSKKTI